MAAFSSTKLRIKKGGKRFEIEKGKHEKKHSN